MRCHGNHPLDASRRFGRKLAPAAFFKASKRLSRGDDEVQRPPWQEIISISIMHLSSCNSSEGHNDASMTPCFFVVSPGNVWWWFIHAHTNWSPQVVAWYQLMAVCKTSSKTLGTCFHSISHFNPQLTWPFAHGSYCLFVMRGDYLRTISASTLAAPLNPCRKFTFSYTKWSFWNIFKS